MNHPQLQRIDDNRIRVENPYGIEVVVFANPDVPVDAAAVDELLGMLEIQRTAESFYQACPDCFSEPPRITRVAVTPDFHKAKGIPVGTVLATRGFVVPQAIGNDVNCGMRLHLTSLAAEQVARSLDDLETVLRRLFFEGGRNIPMTREQRQVMFTNGLTGLLDATPRDLDQGLWALFHQLDIEADLPRIDNRGSLRARRTFGLDDFMGVPGQYTRDSQIGSIGGGNHFVEIQRVKRIIDGSRPMPGESSRTWSR
jgi:tRNA-splicing ligase RtcB (3'-phosphate/5'-hydroxy nucleic acid ligase)